MGALLDAPLLVDLLLSKDYILEEDAFPLAHQFPSLRRVEVATLQGEEDQLVKFLGGREQLEELYLDSLLGPSVAACLAATTTHQDGFSLCSVFPRLKILGTGLGELHDADKVVRAFKSSKVNTGFTFYLWHSRWWTSGLEAEMDTEMMDRLREEHGDFVGEGMLMRQAWWAPKTIRNAWFS